MGLSKVISQSSKRVEHWVLKGKQPGPALKEGIGFNVGKESALNYYNCIAVGTGPIKKRRLEGDLSFLRRITGNGHMFSLHKIEYQKGKAVLDSIDREAFWNKEIFPLLSIGAFWTFKDDFLEELTDSISNLDKINAGQFLQLLENNPEPYLDMGNNGGYYQFAQVKKLRLFKQEEASVVKLIIEDDHRNRSKVLNTLKERFALLLDREKLLQNETNQGKDFSSLFVNSDWERKFDEVLCRLLHPVNRNPLLIEIKELKEACRKQGQQRKFQKPDNTDWQFLYVIKKFIDLGAFNSGEFKKITRLYYLREKLNVPKNILSSFEFELEKELKIAHSPKKDLAIEIDEFIKCVCD